MSPLHWCKGNLPDNYELISKLDSKVSTTGLLSRCRLCSSTELLDGYPQRDAIFFTFYYPLSDTHIAFFTTGPVMLILHLYLVISGLVSIPSKPIPPSLSDDTLISRLGSLKLPFHCMGYPVAFPAVTSLLHVRITQVRTGQPLFLSHYLQHPTADLVIPSV